MTPKLSSISACENAFHKHARSRIIRPIPLRISEVEQVCPQRLSKRQRRYWESMASSIICSKNEKTLTLTGQKTELNTALLYI